MDELGATFSELFPRNLRIISKPERSSSLFVNLAKAAKYFQVTPIRTVSQGSTLFLVDEEQKCTIVKYDVTSADGCELAVETSEVFYTERRNGYYGISAFILSNFFSSFPFLVVVSVLAGTITFYMVKFRPEFSHYVFFAKFVWMHCYGGECNDDCSFTCTTF